MTPDDQINLADWLARWKGVEILREGTLYEMKPFGVIYDATERHVIIPTSHAPRTCPLPVQDKDHFAAIYAHAAALVLDTGRWRGILVVDLSCTLAGFITQRFTLDFCTGSTLARHTAAIRAIRFSIRGNE